LMGWWFFDGFCFFGGMMYCFWAVRVKRPNDLLIYDKPW
jgi:hypothetical protein